MKLFSENSDLSSAAVELPIGGSMEDVVDDVEVEDVEVVDIVDAKDDVEVAEDVAVVDVEGSVDVVDAVDVDEVEIIEVLAGGTIVSTSEAVLLSVSGEYALSVTDTFATRAFPASSEGMAHV